MNRVRVVLCVALLAIGMTGCSLLEPKPDTSRYFMLRALSPEQGPALDGLVLGLGPVAVPDYLDSNEMIDLVGPYEVRYSAQNRWVEPLGGQIVRTLNENLDALLSPDAIVSYPWFAQDGVQLQVEVAFDPIRMDDGGAWTGSARWVVRAPGTRVGLERGDVSFELGSGSIPPDQIATAISTELEGLTVAIAEAVRRQVARQ
ncbi:MAG: PqiC family protein [Longimicrobiales bacterium]